MRTLTDVATHELLDRKIAKRFAVLDQGSKGFLVRDDYVTLVDRIIAVHGLSADAPLAVALRQRYMALWGALAGTMDNDRDGRISPQDFRISVYTGVIGRPGGYERAIQPVFEAVLAIVDADGGGRITKQQVCRSLAAMGLTETDATLAADHLDTDGDGVITVAEMAVADREFYLSTDPQAAGNWAFGQLGPPEGQFE